MALDVSIRGTSVTPEAVRESPVDKSGALLGQTMGAAAGITARSAYNEAEAANAYGQVAPSVVKTAMNAQSGYFKAQLDKELNQQIQDWVEGKNDPEGAAAGFAEAGVLNEQSNTLWDNLATGKMSSKDFTSAVKAFDEKSQRLRAAFDQGMLQPSEMVNRLLATTREHIARNPGLADDLFDHAKRTLQYSGVMDLKDVKNQQQDLLAKAQSKALDRLATDLSSSKLSYDPMKLYTEPSYAQFQTERLIRYRDSLQVAKDMEDGHRLEKLNSESEKTSWFNYEAPKAYEGHKAQYSFAVTDILNSGKPEEEQLNDLRNLNKEMVDKIGFVFKTKGVASHPDAKVYMDDFEAYTQSTYDSIEKAKTQSDKLKIIENADKMNEAQARLELDKEVDRAVLHAIKSLPGPTQDALFWKHPDLGERLFQRVAKVVDIDARNDRDTKDLFTKEGSTGKSGVTDGAAVMMHLNQAGDTKSLPKVLEAYSNSLDNQKLSQEEHLNNLDDFLTLSSDSTNLAQMKELDEDSKISMQNINTNYMVLLGKAMDDMVASKKPFFIKETNEFRDADYKVEELPNGGIMFRSNDPKFQKELNDRFAKRFNKLVKVSAKLFNLSEKQSHDRYKAYFESTFNMGNIGYVGKKGTVSDNIDYKIMGIESGGNATAKNERSTATGAGQFLASTWIEMMNKHFPERIDGLDKEGILALRKDKDLSLQAIAAYRKENQKKLADAGIPVTDTSVYLSHFLGPAGAIKLYKTAPGTKVANIFSGEVINSNPFLKKMTTRDVIKWADDKMGD